MNFGMSFENPLSQQIDFGLGMDNCPQMPVLKGLRQSSTKWIIRSTIASLIFSPFEEQIFLVWKNPTLQSTKFLENPLGFLADVWEMEISHFLTLGLKNENQT